MGDENRPYRNFALLFRLPKMRYLEGGSILPVVYTTPLSV